MMAVLCLCVCTAMFYFAPSLISFFLGGGGQEVAPLLLQLGDTRIDLLHALHLVGWEKCSRAYEVLVDNFGEALVFALELAVLVVVDVLDALEETLIE